MSANDSVRECLTEIVRAEQYRNYNTCPDCDHEHRCNPAKRCFATESKSEGLAILALTALEALERDYEAMENLRVTLKQRDPRALEAWICTQEARDG